VRDMPARDAGKRVNPISRDQWARLDADYWWTVGVGAVFTLARFSEAFLVLRAYEVGVPLALVPLVMVVMNLVYASVAYPVGQLSDRVSHRSLLVAGLLTLVASDLVLGTVGSRVGLITGVSLWGLHMGITQGLLATMVADVAPAELRGTAFGLFNLVSGVAMLAASVVAGSLWDALGSSMTFYAGAGFSVLALGVLACRRPRTRSPAGQ